MLPASVKRDDGRDGNMVLLPTRRILKLPESETQTDPERSTVTPKGVLSALFQTPSITGDVTAFAPPTVLTTPRGVIIRMTLFNLSDTKRNPFVGFTATAVGPLNAVADAPVPSAYPAVPLPAKVVTTAVARTIRRIEFVPVSATYRAFALSE
jgi:hypothetical protein